MRLSQNLTNKLIHPATAAIREASADNRKDLLGYLSSIYALPETTVSSQTGTQPLSKPADSQPSNVEK
jgi:hypothetical protein